LKEGGRDEVQAYDFVHILVDLQSLIDRGTEKGQSPDKITLNIVIDGKGTVWVDDIVLRGLAIEGIGGAMNPLYAK
jgi:hypothetical protein